MTEGVIDQENTDIEVVDQLSKRRASRRVSLQRRGVGDHNGEVARARID
jgi:hypothetical protein